MDRRSSTDDTAALERLLGRATALADGTWQDMPASPESNSPARSLVDTDMLRQLSEALDDYRFGIRARAEEERLTGEEAAVDHEFVPRF